MALKLTDQGNKLVIISVMLCTSKMSFSSRYTSIRLSSIQNCHSVSNSSVGITDDLSLDFVHQSCLHTVKEVP